MCDYSLHHVSSRPAKIGDRLITRNFHAGTLGFAAPEDKSVAVCVLPGTELSTRKVQRLAHLPLNSSREAVGEHAGYQLDRVGHDRRSNS